MRERIYKPLVGELPAHQVSTAIASLAFIFLTYLMIGKTVVALSNSTLLFIGLVWVMMTISFEFGFGHYVDKASWNKLFADYNIFKGHLWGVFLLIIMLSPILVKWIVDL